MKTSFFAPDSVLVMDPYFVRALELDVDNLLILDEDRLLAGFRETAAYIAGMGKEERAAFMKHKKRYGGGWENSLIGGHTLGHYMTAVSQGVINPGLSGEDRDALKKRLDSIVAALAECQDMTAGTAYEGYLFGAEIPEPDHPDSQFDHVEAGETNIVHQAWVPWYTMHKILAGLTDAYAIAGNEMARDVAEKLAWWISERANGWTEETRQTVLATEYGGMNDALYELYKVSDSEGKEAFKKAAHQFDETELFELVLSGTVNGLNGKHANTTIPKFLGALCRYEVDETEIQYLEYAKAFWDMVTERHTYITGGNSEDEHFGADYVLQEDRTNCNNETCNTYNMLKLSRRLFLITGEKKYADYYENTLINAILSSQDHKTGRTMYFQPMATGFQKVFGTVDSNFWCCTGSGMENFTKLQDSIYFVKQRAVGVNLYIASKAAGDGYEIVQTGDLSKGDTMTFTVSGAAIRFNLLLRIPTWVKDRVTVCFDGDVYEYETENGYIVIPEKKLADGVSFTVCLPMEACAENLPDGENTYAFRYGPFVLSAGLGTDKQTTASHGVSVTVPATKAVSRDTIGIRNAASVKEFMEKLPEHLIKTEGKMEFTLQGTTEQYIFTPHYNQDEQSYGIYWTYYIDEEGISAEAVLTGKQTGRMEESVVDKMEQAGRGQYESRFLLPDGRTKDGLVDHGSVGEDAPSLTRAALAGGSFSYKMQTGEGDHVLLLTFLREDNGKPLRIQVGSTVIADEMVDDAKAETKIQTLSKADEELYYQRAYRIPGEVVASCREKLEVLEYAETVTKNVIEIQFFGTDTMPSARICKSVLLLKPFRTENHLQSLLCNGVNVENKNGVYTIWTPYDKNPEVIFTLADPGGYIELDGNAMDESEPKKLITSDVETVFEIVVYAQNFKLSERAKLVVKRDYAGLHLQDCLVKAFHLTGTLDGAVPVRQAGIPEEMEKTDFVYEDRAGDKTLKMTGEYGLLLLPDASVLGESYTIGFWMKPEKTGASYDPTLAGGFTKDYWLNLTLDGKMWSSNGSIISSAATGAYRAGEWQQVTLVVDGEKKGTAENTVYGELYVNGVKVNSGNIAAGLMVQPGNALYFGINPWDAIFTGAVEEIFLFRCALTETEVQGLAKKEDIL